MCGFVCVLEIHHDADRLRDRVLQLARRLRHRGPDWSGVYSDAAAILAHERLAIVDVEHGAQPLTNETGERVLAVNGEIYNHRELEAGSRRPLPLQDPLRLRGDHPPLRAAGRRVS